MAQKSNKTNYNEVTLYNKIVFLSRNKSLYTEINLNDTFQNRITLIILHVSFLFIKIKEHQQNEDCKTFSQKIFDLIFKSIENNMREIGYGDVSVNKNMKFLTKTFYSIILYCEKYDHKSIDSKKIFFNKHLDIDNDVKNASNIALIDYFNKYHSFCLDLTMDKVLMGELNFNYK